jgi:FtsH-binding integral membrane protein
MDSLPLLDKWMTRSFKGMLVVLFVATPRLVLGADATSLCTSIQDFKGAIGCAIGLLTPVVALLIGFALVVFLYGLLQYVSKGDNAEERTKARDFIIFGIIGLFVMISVWGLVGILLNTFSGSSSSGSGGNGQQTGNAGLDIYDPYYKP